MSGSSTTPLHVSCVCTGNICRSPMAEIMLRVALRREGLDDEVVVSSAGTGGWHQGDPMDPRAATELASRGLPTEHSAAALTNADLDADLLVALDRGHARHLRAEGADPDRVRLLRSFDPDAHGDDVDDPYFGDASDFTKAAIEIDRALPGLVTAIRDLLDDRARS